jgi:SAM-dependent methyltransferase
MNPFLTSNQKLWDELTPIHLNSEFYDVAGFKAGRSTLKSLEREEVGAVTGKSLLHLQCHFGMDTLSWARQGAQVTGIDFSSNAIQAAKNLSQELGISARFICSNLYAAPAVLSDQFDLVYTSYGVLPWLPDLAEWARVIAYFLKSGGVLHVIDSHPLSYIFSDETPNDLQIRSSYFHADTPQKWENDGDYADRSAKISNPSFEWTHSLSDILNALLRAGLFLEFVHEFPYTFYQSLPLLEADADGWWWFPDKKRQIPLMFSLKAGKP